MTKEYVVMTDSRLAAMERQLTAVLRKLDVVVRLEERQDATNRRLDRQDARMDSHSGRIGGLEQVAAASSKQTGMLERAGWVVATAGVGLLTFFLRG